MITTNEHAHPLSGRLPLLALLHPRRHLPLVVGFVLAGLAAAKIGAVRGWPLWQSVAAFLIVMVPPAIVKWREDARSYGSTLAIAGALVVLQSFHTVEHLVQWTQRHVLHWSLRASTGLLSPANSEWVHFVWNWLVLGVLVVLVVRKMRGPWAWAMLAWAAAHTFEHSYMFVRFLQVSSELERLGVGKVTAQGLPGIVGRDGWLDQNSTFAGTAICRIPFLTTANRVDAHAAWNTGEVLLLLPSVHVLIRASVPRAPRLRGLRRRSVNAPAARIAPGNS